MQYCANICLLICSVTGDVFITMHIAFGHWCRLLFYGICTYPCPIYIPTLPEIY